MGSGNDLKAPDPLMQVELRHQTVRLRKRVHIGPRQDSAKNAQFAAIAKEF